MKKLWTFQQKAFDDCYKFLWGDNKKDSGIAVLPTGAGKSVILAHLSKHASKEYPLLFVVPSVELLKQNADAIEAEGGQAGIYCGSLNKKEIKPITVATILSLKEDGIDFKNMGIKRVIVDECHYKASEIGVFNDFINDLKPLKVLGLTATAFKLLTDKGFSVLKTLDRIRPTLFRRFIHVTQVQSVIDNNRWSKIDYKTYKYDTDLLESNTSGTEYTKESIELSNSSQEINNKICIQLKRLFKENPNYKVLVFVNSVDNAKIMNEWCNKTLPVKSKVVHANTAKKERENTVSAFKGSTPGRSVNILINHSTFTTGFDSPELSHVILGRATMSFSLYYQIVGRLVRKSQNKLACRFIDFCGNTQRFGKIENIIYKYVSGYGWGVFTGDKLVTGVPLNSNIKVTEQYILHPPKLKKIDKGYALGFGIHGDKPLWKIPKHYRDFLLTKFDWGTSKRELNIIEQLKNLEHNDFVKLFHKTH